MCGEFGNNDNWQKQTLLVHRRHSQSISNVFPGNFSAHCINAFPLVRDILRLEEIAHGHEAKTYILADLHNALGMLTVHQQVPLAFI